MNKLESLQEHGRIKGSKRSNNGTNFTRLVRVGEDDLRPYNVYLKCVSGASHNIWGIQGLLNIQRNLIFGNIYIGNSHFSCAVKSCINRFS